MSSARETKQWNHFVNVCNFKSKIEMRSLQFIDVWQSKTKGLSMCRRVNTDIGIKQLFYCLLLLCWHVIKHLIWLASNLGRTHWFCCYLEYWLKQRSRLLNLPDNEVFTWNINDHWDEFLHKSSSIYIEAPLPAEDQQLVHKILQLKERNFCW